jgi:hypothetical protein
MSIKIKNNALKIVNLAPFKTDQEKEIVKSIIELLDCPTNHIIANHVGMNTTRVHRIITGQSEMYVSEYLKFKQAVINLGGES